MRRSIACLLNNTAPAIQVSIDRGILALGQRVLNAHIAMTGISIKCSTLMIFLIISTIPRKEK